MQHQQQPHTLIWLWTRVKSINNDSSVCITSIYLYPRSAVAWAHGHTNTLTHT